ncbi:MAG TPA: chromate efflux transporter [Gaiellaceae bacterium]|nr:chromate efflux transporter [Gaiellaceae bacterium]
MGAPKTDLRGVLRRWGRLGVLGVGGPQAHTALLREMMVVREAWLTAEDFQDAVAVTSLLPGPASTQLAIYCARVAGGPLGGVVGGLAFILPGFLIIVGLSALFLGHSESPVLLGAAAGAVAAAVTVIAAAGIGFARGYASRRGFALARTVAYALAACVITLLSGPWVLAVLLGAGLIEVALRLRSTSAAVAVITAHATVPGLVWVAFKVGALSFGGGLVIIPLMQHDVVSVHHWLSEKQFADAVALGQLTPGPVVLTIAVVGYGAAGFWGAALAATVAFLPSFLFVMLGAGRFEQLRHRPAPRAFLDGAGPAAVGAILGAALLLAPQALQEWWQPIVIVIAALLLLRGRSSFTALAVGLAIGLVAGIA